MAETSGYWWRVHREALRRARLHVIGAATTVLVSVTGVIAAVWGLLVLGSDDAARDEIIARLSITGVSILVITTLYLYWIARIPAEWDAAANTQAKELQDRLNPKRPLRIKFPKEANMPWRSPITFRHARRFQARGRSPEDSPELHELYIQVTNESPQSKKNVGIRLAYVSLPYPTASIDADMIVALNKSANIDIPPHMGARFLLGKTLRQEHTDFGERNPDFVTSAEFDQYRMEALINRTTGLTIPHSGGALELLRNDGVILAVAVMQKTRPRHSQ